MASIYKLGHVWWMKKKVKGKWRSFSLDTKIEAWRSTVPS